VNGPTGWPSEYNPEDILPSPAGSSSLAENTGVLSQPAIPYVPYSIIAKVSAWDEINGAESAKPGKKVAAVSVPVISSKKLSSANDELCAFSIHGNELF
jgi:hypothetical protein